MTQLMAKRGMQQPAGEAGRPPAKTFVMHAAREVYEEWARKQGYDERRLFLASFIAFTHLSVEMRSRFFEALDEWERGGFEGQPPEVLEAVPAATTSASPAAPRRANRAQ